MATKKTRKSMRGLRGNQTDHARVAHSNITSAKHYLDRGTCDGALQALEHGAEAVSEARWVGRHSKGNELKFDANLVLSTARVRAKRLCGCKG
jgi:hypothetical protein